MGETEESRVKVTVVEISHYAVFLQRMLLGARKNNLRLEHRVLPCVASLYASMNFSIASL